MKYKIKYALIFTIFPLVIFILVNTIFEVWNAEFPGGFGFSEGYLTITGKRVGHSVYSYFIAAVMLFLANYIADED
ncbi:MAG: hypothetical protein WBF83_12035 [Moheibacter sp.]